MLGKMKNIVGKILSIEKISIDSFKIEIQSELDCIIPGQFISVLCPVLLILCVPGNIQNVYHLHCFIQ